MNRQLTYPQYTANSLIILPPEILIETHETPFLHQFHP